MERKTQFGLQRAISPTAIFTTSLSLLMVLTLRYLWMLSLGNRDEIFFSTGAGRLEMGGDSIQDWLDLFTWIWWKHNGRTADWLSSAIYLFGPATGKWITSILTVTIVGIIIWCMQKSLKFFDPTPFRAHLVTPVAILALLFSYAYSDLKLLSNLTMYSAAVCNYMVPTAFIFVSVTLVLTGHRARHVYYAAVLGFITATMHEQAATIVATLAILLVFAGPKRWKLNHRTAGAAIAFLGVIEMFAAPGLHSKLGRATMTATDSSDSIAQKIIETFFILGYYYPVVIALVSVISVFTLLHNVNDPKRAPQRTVLAIFIATSTIAWGMSHKYPGLDYPLGVTVYSGIACLLMMTGCLLAPLLSSIRPVRFGFVLLLCAASSLAIPAVAGLSQNLRVYNFATLFLVSYFIWNIYTGLQATNVSRGNINYTRFTSLMLALIVLMVSLSALRHFVFASQENYEPGLADLRSQHSSCNQNYCPVTDPDVPYPRALSGYLGTEDVADVLWWIEK